MFLVCVVSASKKRSTDLLARNSIDIVAVQESWEKEDPKIDVGFLVRWDGFLVHECLVSEVEFITIW